jgi:hypothetical protein
MPTPSIPAAILEGMVRDSIGRDLEAVADECPRFNPDVAIKRLAFRLLPVLARLDRAEGERRARYHKPN